MSAILYRWLVRLHPRVFRERFGEEMCRTFDDAAGAGSAPSLLDGVASLLRQWLFRSGIWKPAAGLVVSATFLFAWAFFVSTSDANRVGRAIVADQVKARARNPLNRVEFNEEAASAVAMLARFRETGERRTERRAVTKIDSQSSSDSSRN